MSCTVPDCPHPVVAKGLCSGHYNQSRTAKKKREEFIPRPLAPDGHAINPEANAEEPPFHAFIRKYRDDPVGFVADVLGTMPDEWQAEFLEAIASGQRRIAIRSSHGVGKSTASSWAAIWFLLTRYPCKIVITAPTSAQLFDALYAELRSQIGRLPDFLQALVEITTDRVVLKADPTGAFISCRTSSKERPESLQGVHSEHVMLIADEASGIPEAVFEAAAGSMSGESAVTILLGNPIRSTGYFHSCFFPPLLETYWTKKVSCYDTSRVSSDFIEDMKRRYGEESNAFRTRCLGEFPLADDDTLIGRGIVEAAITRDIAVDPQAPLIIGVDPARYGSDRTAMCRRRGNVVEEIRHWQGVDLMSTAGIIMAEWNGLTDAERSSAIVCIDSIGLGAGLLDRLVELGLPAIGVNVSESSSLMSNCARLRDELWFRLKEWFEAKSCKIPENADLVTDLTSPRYSYLSNGKLKVEGKSEMRQRGVRSPDLADCIALTFSSSAATMTSGNQRISWGKPLSIDTDWVV